MGAKDSTALSPYSRTLIFSRLIRHPFRVPTKRHWKVRELALLGKQTDVELAGCLGITPPSVRNKRIELGILACGWRSVNWTRKLEGLLGEYSDRDLARRIGCHLMTVYHRRIALGIRSYKAQRAVVWTRKWTALLGKVPDPWLARRLGVSRTTVRARRLKLGIGPLRAARGWRPTAGLAGRV